MADRLDAVLDHVAIAVPSWEAAEQRWKDELGGGVVSWGDNGVFYSRQLRFANTAKIELLAPSAGSGPEGFVQRFLQRFGSTIHHVTLKVPDLEAAIGTLDDAGLETVDVRMDNPWWQEAFLRPRQVGGLVVQVAFSGQTDAQWAERMGHIPQAPAPGAMALTGPLLRHPDRTAAARLWTLLGADVASDGAELVCTWPQSPLTVRIVEGAPAGPIALLGHGAEPLAAHPEFGPELRIN